MALREVLALEFLLGALDHRPVEDARLGKAHVAQALLQVIRLERLEPGEFQRCDCRALFQHHHQNLPVDLEANVLEEPGREQRLDRRRRLFVSHGVPHLDRQVGEHGSGLGALDALDPDILDLEWIKGQCRTRQQRKNQTGKQFLLHEFLAKISRKQGG